MEKQTKIYLNFFKYRIDDFIRCENCGARAVTIHPIIPCLQRGKNNIENLIGLCRKCHNAAHAEEIDKSSLEYIHKCFINRYDRKIHII